MLTSGIENDVKDIFIKIVNCDKPLSVSFTDLYNYIDSVHGLRNRRIRQIVLSNNIFYSLLRSKEFKECLFITGQFYTVSSERKADGRPVRKLQKFITNNESIIKDQQAVLNCRLKRLPIRDSDLSC